MACRSDIFDDDCRLCGSLWDKRRSDILTQLLFRRSLSLHNSKCPSQLQHLLQQRLIDSPCRDNLIRWQEKQEQKAAVKQIGYFFFCPACCNDKILPLFFFPPSAPAAAASCCTCLLPSRRRLPNLHDQRHRRGENDHLKQDWEVMAPDPQSPLRL